MLGKLFPFLLGIQVTFRGRTVVNFLVFFRYFLGPKSRGRNWRTQSWVDPRSVGNLANARANANTTGTLQRGHGSEEPNPPWLLWSCCDVDIFADILPILFGYGLEMSEKKHGCFEICGKRSCSDRTWVVSVLSISQYDLRYLPYIAYNVTWIPKQHIPSKQEQQEQTLRFLQKVDWPFPWIPIDIPLITFWKHINFLPQNTSPPKKKQHPSEVE